MESGLEDRNNIRIRGNRHSRGIGLNGVRPRRPEQSGVATLPVPVCEPVSMESGLEDRNNSLSVNRLLCLPPVSMESGLEDRNNRNSQAEPGQERESQWSPA